MRRQTTEATRGRDRYRPLLGLSIVLAVTLAGASGAQNQENPPPRPPPPRPAAPAATPQQPAARWPQPANNRAALPNNGGAMLPNNGGAAANGRAPTNTRPPGSLQVASLNTNQTANARAVQSRAFLGHPGPAGSTETQTRNGNIVRTAADGSVLDVSSPRHGMSIHHALDGSRRITVEQPDHSRIFVTSRGLPYVQHPYMIRGRAYDHRTYYVQGRTFHQFYRPYVYGGASLDVYAPSRFYSPQFYQWTASRFNAPQPFQWGYVTSPTPWYGYYKGYFTPDTSYASPLAWLADFVIGSSLAIAYTTAPPNSQAPQAAADGPAVTPQVKQMVAEEVGRQVRQEAVEAQQNALNREPAPGAGGVVQELSDGQSHVFVAAADLDLVDPSGRRCMISEGDVVQVTSAANAGTSTADAIVLASKGGLECERAAQVQVAVSDLQEMQNHMRETIDMGMASSKAGKQSPTVNAGYVAAAPPPDPNAAHELDQQAQIAAAAEG